MTGEFTPTTASAYIPEVWSAKVFEYAYEDVLIADLVVSLDSDVASYGDIVHMPVMAVLATTTKSADVDVVFTNNTDTDATVTVNTYEYVAVAPTLEVMKKAKYDLVGLNQKSMGKAIGNRWDAQIAGLYSGLSQSAGTAGAGLTDAALIEAVRLLDVANAPNEDRNLCLHPSAWADFIGIEKFYNSATFPQQKALSKYQIAEVYGLKTYKSNNISASGTTERNLVFHREAFGLARSIKIDVMMQDMARAGRKEIVAYTLYGLGEIRDAFGVTVLS